jgi:ABC-type multidrug transport system ATPase subunit
MLQISGLQKTFEGRPVLRRVDLRVEPGESVALVGTNGSGKTTTLRSIVGLTLPDEGVLLVDGIDVRRRPREARRRMSYMPQRPAFPDVLTVREILTTVAQLRAVGASRVGEELVACGLEPIAGQRMAHLSGGERQRVALASALLPDVRLFLFDEPSASLDGAATKLLLCRVEALRERGCAVLFTTHVTHDLDALATRIVRIENGRCTGAPMARSHEAELVDPGGPASDVYRVFGPLARA